jgi:chromosomal replication initiator protein
MQTRSAFARLLDAPETASALSAVRELAAAVRDGRAGELANPLYLHGPAGTGKTTLVSALADDVCRRGTDHTVCVLSANDFARTADDEGAAERLKEARRADLLIVEDLQHLPIRAGETLARLIDDRLRRRLQLVLTASAGQARKAHRGERFSARLASRLAGGLVVALQPLQAESRRRFLQALARRCKLAVSDDVLDWLAKHLTGGGRQLEGALHQVEALQKLLRRPPDVASLREHFLADAGRPTVERIVAHVSGYYRVEPKQLQSARRQRSILLPRQVGMYLARQLTPLTLQQIGAYFGGRDHTTVLHACKKVEAALKTDPALSGAVRQMHAELS